MLRLAGRRLVLASGSPRRSELLRSIGLRPEVRPAEIDESVWAAETPRGYVRRLADAKAIAVAARGEIVLAADTTVEAAGHVLGKPTDERDLRRMLALLSGATHHVHTAVTLVEMPATGRIVRSGVTVTSAVTMVTIDADLADWYVAQGESADKAGGYALQGAGAALVSRVEGSVSNVIGLPLAETLALLRSEPAITPRPAGR